jgi:hypothetical protein
MTTVNYELESLTLDEVKWLTIAINHQIARINRQSQSFSDADAWKYRNENNEYVRVLLSAKTKLINSIT